MYRKRQKLGREAEMSVSELQSVAGLQARPKEGRGNEGEGMETVRTSEKGREKNGYHRAQSAGLIWLSRRRQHGWSLRNGLLR